MKKRALKINWAKHTPPGFDWETERGLFIGALGIACFVSFFFFVNLSDAAHYALDRNSAPYFYEVLGKSFLCFPIAIAIMLGSIAMNYAHYHAGSKSIYLMRRLPDPWERHRRCITVPLWAAAITLAAAIVLFFVYYGIYMAWITKHGYHPYANQLELLLKNWSVM